MSSRREWPQDLNTPHRVLANFRPTVTERFEARQASAQLRRPGIDPNHLSLLRKLPCTVCHAVSRIDPHHLKSGPARAERGFGRRSTDRWAVPICRFHHDEVERAGSRGEPAWFAKWGIVPCDLAKALWDARGNLARMGAILVAHKQAGHRKLARLTRVNALMAHGLTKAEAEEQIET